MAPVALSFVVRFSSEDVIFKAENLCKGKADATGTWKIAKEDMNCGRMEGEFQLEKASYISHIDIGNCGSAFIEILVGNSMWPQDKPFVTLLPSAVLMTPTECKHWTKTHAVRMFNQSAFSKHALGSQWDRIRVVLCQPYRSDKQFGLSFMRMGSVPDDSTLSPTEGVSGKIATPIMVGHSDDETDEDGVMRLKKASGLMGCLRNLEKGSPEVSLNRAGKLLQAALDSRSPGTPRNSAKNKRSLSQSSPEISSSPESPYKKKDSQSPCEGPNEKRKKKEKKWSLAGDIHDEVALFLEEIDFTKMDLEKITFKDLRDQMESQRGCPLTKLEKKVFLEMAKATIQKLMSEEEEDPLVDVIELSKNKLYDSPTLKKTVTKEPNATKKHPNKSFSKTATKQERAPNITKPLSSQPSTSTNSTHEIKSPCTEKPPKLIPIDEKQDVDFPGTCNSSRILVDDGDEDLPSMLYPSPDGKKPMREKLFNTGEFRSPPVKDKSSTSLVECPLCNRFFPATEVEFHASFCIGDADAAPRVAEPEVELVPCPICSKLFPVTQIEQHADECIDAFNVTEGSNDIPREPLAI